jgi:hypothetical protein
MRRRLFLCFGPLAFAAASILAACGDDDAAPIADAGTAEDSARPDVMTRVDAGTDAGSTPKDSGVDSAIKDADADADADAEAGAGTDSGIPADTVGAPAWSFVFDEDHAIELRAIRPAPDGSVLIAGYHYGEMTLGTTKLPKVSTADGFIVKLTSAGAVVWAKNITAQPARTNDFLLVDDIVLDDAGDVIAAVDCGTGPCGADGFVSTSRVALMKLGGADGQAKWITSFDVADTSIGFAGASFDHVAAKGDAIALVGRIEKAFTAPKSTGSLTLTPAKTDFFVLMLDGNGKATAGTTYTEAGPFDEFFDVGFAPDGDVLIAGRFEAAGFKGPGIDFAQASAPDDQNPSFYPDQFYARLSPDLTTVRWSQQMKYLHDPTTPTASSGTDVRDVGHDANGAMWLGGYADSRYAVSFAGLNLAKVDVAAPIHLDADGNGVEFTPIGSTATSIYTMAVTGGGDVAVHGYQYLGLTVDSTTLAPPLNNTRGGYFWVRSAGGAQKLTGFTIANPAGSEVGGFNYSSMQMALTSSLIVLGGTHYGTFDFAGLHRAGATNTFSGSVLVAFPR